MKKQVILLLLFALTCGCAAPPPDSTQPPSSAITTQGEQDFVLQDISGQLIPLSSEYLKGFALSYTLGWRPDQKGYTRIERGAVYGDLTINEVSSFYNTYYTSRHGESTRVSVCNQSRYFVSCDSEVAGILQLAENMVVFFPYENADASFFLLHPVEDERRSVYSGIMALQQNGDPLKIQPMGILFSSGDEETILSLLETAGAGSPRWYDVRLRFSSVSVSGYCHGEQDEIFATRAFGYLEGEDAISVNGEIFLSELLGEKFMAWAF